MLSKKTKPPVQQTPKSAAAAAGASNSAPNASTDDVARLAYALWQSRGCPVGSPEEDWFRAEQELAKKRD